MKFGTSILILCLNKEFGKALSSQLANILGMHYADCKEIIEYDLFDSGAILQKCGIEYLNKREKSVVKDISNYENSLIFVEYDIYKTNQKIFDKVHPQIYLRCSRRKLQKDDVINDLAFEERDAFLKENCDLTVDISGTSKSVVNKIIKEIKQKL